MLQMEDFSNLVPDGAETKLIFFVNGKKVIEPQPDPEWTLLWYLRKKILLTGSKYGCGEGGCGACTVMLSEYKRKEDCIKHYAVNACLMPVCAVHGLAVTTVEGIGSTQTKLHPVQERIAKAHGSQCGFCTPGIVMSMYALLRSKSKIDYNNIDSALQGNLCRCTGYRPIIEGLKTFTEDWETNYINGSSNGVCSLGENCCKNKNTNDNKDLYNKTIFQPYDETQEPIFPPELKLNSNKYDSFLFYKSHHITWLRPTNIDELSLIKSHIPNSKIIVGNSEVGVEMKFKKMYYPVLLYTNLIEEMKIFDVNENYLTIGASTSLTDLRDILINKTIKYNVKSDDGVFQEIVEMLNWFAGTQIRNVASIAGNIVTASPISDLNPILMACGAELNVYNPQKGHSKIRIDENFFKSYRKTALNANEIVLSINIPYSENYQYFKAYKQSRRKEDDIAIVTAAFSVKFENNSKIVKKARLCFGGMGPTTLYAKNTALKITGMEWNETLNEIVFNELIKELRLHESSPGGMIAYRKSLCLSLFFKFYLHTLQRINRSTSMQDTNLCSIVPKSAQIFEIRDDNRLVTDTIGLPIIHASAYKQVTGEAIYCDDVPPVQGELFLKLIFSIKPHAKIISINATKALQCPGVEAFYCAKDLEKENNQIGPVVRDEEIFSSERVTSKACVIGAIVAQSEDIARKAKDLVIVEYEEISPVIVTLEDAIENNSFFPGCPKTMVKGNVIEAFKNADYTLNGICRNGAQEHFYLETNSVIATRKEDELEIIASTQSPADIARNVSSALGIPNHKIVAKVRRLGGGFGGKETRTSILAVPVAIAAYKLKRSVRGVLDRDEDMESTGNRHPHLINFKVAFNKSGKIVAAVYDIYNNAGNSTDLSFSVNTRASFHVDNCYFVPNFKVNGYICRTNLPSNTAFRGFGGPQAMLATEVMIRDVAQALGKSYEEVAAINMYKEGDLTHFNQVLSHCTIERCWNECIKSSDYWKRKDNVADFNRKNRWKKKGLALVPTKYGISFQIDVLNQGGALVMIYTDGSVLLSIGGTEMGQGLFTKMIQVASRALEINIEKINIMEASTDKIPNSSPTAGSISSDLYGMAVIDACNKLMNRLKPYKERSEHGKWEEWISDAYVDRVELTATGFYVAPKIEYNYATNSGQMFEYFTYGAACSEVLIDCLTGDHQVLRTDIVMDIGESLNPAIDIGQIEGAFIQGYGFYTMEEVVNSPRGDLYTRGPGTYKIPGFSDIPKEFNVSLLKGAPNPRAVYSSKAVGEPPLFLAASVFFAIKEAIAAARVDANVEPHFRLDAPATCERIRMACEDRITKQVQLTVNKDVTPWNVVA